MDYIKTVIYLAKPVALHSRNSFVCIGHFPQHSQSLLGRNACRNHAKYRMLSVDFIMIFLLARQVGKDGIESKWDIFESTLPIMIAGLVITSLDIFFPRRFDKVAQTHWQKCAKNKNTKTYFEYLNLVKLQGGNRETLKRFLDTFST